MRDRERTRKQRAGLAVLLLTVAEEERIARRIAVAQLAGLADEAARQTRRVLDLRTVLDDEVVGDHAASDHDRRIRPTDERAVAETRRTVHHRAVADADVVDQSCVHDLRPDADRAAVGRGGRRKAVGKALQLRNQRGTVTVNRLQIGLVRGQPLMDLDLASARLVQDGHLDAVAEGRRTVHVDLVDVHHQRARADVVIRQIAADVRNARVVADRHVVQRRLVKSRGLLHAARKGEVLGETTQTADAGEGDVTDTVGREALGDLYGRPILSTAPVGLQRGDLGLGQLAKGHVSPPLTSSGASGPSSRPSRA